METSITLMTVMIFVLVALMPTLAILYATRLVTKSLRKLVQVIRKF